MSSKASSLVEAYGNGVGGEDVKIDCFAFFCGTVCREVEDELIQEK